MNDDLITFLDEDEPCDTNVHSDETAEQVEPWIIGIIDDARS